MRRSLLRLSMVHSRGWVRTSLIMLLITTIYMIVTLATQSGQLTAQAQRIDTSVAEREALASDVDTLRGQVLALGEQPVVAAPTAGMAAGSPGQNGQDGEDGAAGIPGLDGASGAPGIDGLNGVPLPGVTGASGAAGADGVAGASGASGQPGVSGVDGVDGVDGINGADGSNGANGSNGEPGRGISMTECVGSESSSYWEITYTDGEVVNAGGPCSVGDRTAAPPGAASPTE